MMWRVGLVLFLLLEVGVRPGGGSGGPLPGTLLGAVGAAEIPGLPVPSPELCGAVLSSCRPTSKTVRLWNSFLT